MGAQDSDEVTYKIYQIECLVDRKKYISFAKSYIDEKSGRHVGPEKTFRDYMRWSKKENFKQKFSESLRESMKKYEQEQFRLTILEEYDDYNQTEIQDRVQELIQINGTLYPSGLNHTKDYSRNKQVGSSSSQTETQSSTTDSMQSRSRKKQVTIKHQIYLITCLLNEKRYVGQCLTHHRCRDGYTIYGYERRFKSHISAAHRDTEGKNYKLKIAIETHGQEQFKTELLKECETQEQADEYEIQYIKDLNTLHPNGYNVDTGGQITKIDISQKVTKYQKLYKQIDINSPEKYIREVKDGYVLRIERIKTDYCSKSSTKEEKYQDALKTLQMIHETQQQHTSQYRESPQASATNS